MDITSEDKFETLIFLPKNENRKGEGGLRTNGVFKQNFAELPLVTIATIVLNGERFLEATIKSIINQSYSNKEYIIIDGGSTDSSIEIIKKYENQIDYWISEKDRGIGDAFNKAVVLSRGTYLNFQGDGDGFYNKNVLKDILTGIEPSNDILISGRILRVNIDDKPIYISKQKKFFSKSSLLYRMSMPHQGLFMNIIFFKKYGLFNIDNKFSMDYELLLRAYQNFPNVVLKDLIVAKWRADGLGNNREMEIFKEYDFIKRTNKVSSLFFLSLINYWILFKFKIKQKIFIK